MNTLNWHRRHQRKSITYTVLVYALFFLALFSYSTTRIKPPKHYEDVIEINLGDMEIADGETPPTAYAVAQSSSKVSKTTTTPTDALPKVGVHSDVTTTESDVSARIAQEAADNAMQSMRLQQVEPRKDPIALLRPGITDGEMQKSWKDSYGDETKNQGIGQGQGDMGSTQGVSGATDYGTSISIVSGLGNRSLNTFPRINETFDYEGIVLIKVLFRRDGTAISATQDIRNSTTTKKQLVDIALFHSKKITLNEDTNAPYQQAITFRFIFKLRL